MKRLIVISVVFALVAGAAFAVDLSGAVVGTVNFLEGDSQKDANGDGKPIGASASLNRIRIEGSGENDDGTFGAWLRFQPDWGHYQVWNTKPDWSGEPDYSSGPPADLGTSQDFGALTGAWGNAWWKPIDLLKITIGGNPDGFYGKEGVTGWGFYQTASDTGVVNPGNVWGGGYGPVNFRNAFYGGYGAAALHLTVSPIDILDINIAVPFWDGGPDGNPEGKAAYIFKRTTAQVDVKLDFGNIALTYVGAENKYEPDLSDLSKFDPTAGADPATLFLYFGLTSIENLGIDVGLGFPLPLNKKFTKDDDGFDATFTRVTPIAAGLGAKFTTGGFGIKFRLVASFAGSTKAEGDMESDPDPDPFKLTTDILPFFAVSDTMRIYFSAGLGITGVDKNADGDVVPEKDAWGDDTKAVVAWHINPYIEIGQEWGPKFLAGIRIWSDGKDVANLKDGEKEKIVKWGIPLAMHIGF
jgi:hypothetical protein